MSKRRKDLPKIEPLPVRGGILPNGQEVLDSRPVAVPLGYTAPEDIKSMVDRMTRAALDARNGQDVESFDESNDFEIDDGYDFSSPYGEGFDPEFHGTKDMERRAGFAQGPSKKALAAEAKRRKEFDAAYAEGAKARQARIDERAEAFKKAFPDDPGSASRTRP